MSTVEVRAFAKLHLLFKERKWHNPVIMPLPKPMSADELRCKLNLSSEDVEAVFINHKVSPLTTILHGGERVAFVPPGIPSIHRYWLGFYNEEKS